MYKTIIVALSALLTACATSPSVDSMVEKGGEVVEGGVGSLIGDDGVTLTAVDRSWNAYLAPDGKKEIFIKSKNLRETLSWRRKEDGTFCEVMYRPRAEQCHDESQVLVKNAKGVYIMFINGEKNQYPFKAKSGNTYSY